MIRNGARRWLVLSMLAGVTVAVSHAAPPSSKMRITGAGTLGIDSGAAGLPLAAFDPFVLADAEGYHAFFSSIFCERNGDYFFSWDPANPASCNLQNTVVGTAYAFSKGGTSPWRFRSRPVLAPSLNGWDSGKVETPSVVRVGGRLYLFYSADARGFDQRFQLGVATMDVPDSISSALLSDGAGFVRRSTPLIPYNTSSSGPLNNVQEPSVLFIGNKFIVYFIGLALGRPQDAISAPQQTIESVGLGRQLFNSTLQPLERQDRLLNGVNIAEITILSGGFYLVSTTMPPGPGDFHRGESLEYRHSLDGVHWNAPFPLPVPFAGWGTFAPTVVPMNDRFRLFYTALAVDDRPCFPVPPGGRFGLPVDGGLRCVHTSIASVEGRVGP